MINSDRCAVLVHVDHLGFESDSIFHVNQAHLCNVR